MHQRTLFSCSALLMRLFHAICTALKVDFVRRAETLHLITETLCCWSMPMFQRNTLETCARRRIVFAFVLNFCAHSFQCFGVCGNSTSSYQSLANCGVWTVKGQSTKNNSLEPFGLLARLCLHHNSASYTADMSLNDHCVAPVIDESVKVYECFRASA